MEQPSSREKGSEQLPPLPSLGPEQSVSSSELRPKAAVEFVNGSGETESTVAGTTSLQPATSDSTQDPLGLTVADGASIDPVANNPVTNPLPAIAADDDLIEKAWVDQAKKIIEKTRDDPYEREREFRELQADYLFKRYGRTLGVDSQS